MPSRLADLDRLTLIDRCAKLEELLKTAVNMLYQNDVGYRSTWRTEAIKLLYPDRVCNDTKPGTACGPHRHDFNCRYYTGPNLA